MSGSTESDDLDCILARFHQDMENASDARALLEVYCSRHPQFADEFREVLHFGRILELSRQEHDRPQRERVGDFRIVRRIARGGMGEIYEAIQEPLERRVVVKTIRHEYASQHARERFLREQHVLAKLHETHTVPIFAAGEQDGVQYFAMPYIEGASLDHIVRTATTWASVEKHEHRTPRLGELARMVLERSTAGIQAADQGTHTTESGTPVEKSVPDGARAATATANACWSLSLEYFRSVAQVMADVAESLEHAHRHGFLHRDLKPSNIMVDTAGQSWVIDFGLAGHIQGELEPQFATTESSDAQAASALTAGVIGTPGYMSPEQAAGKTVDERTDIWGLGVTLYELLTLRRAYPAEPRSPIGRGTSFPPPTAPRRLIRSLPRDLEAICLKALHVDPAGRYRTAGEIADDLRRWLRSGTRLGSERT